MFDISVIIPQIEGFVPLVPVWFYLISTVAYALALVICFLVSYFAFRIYRTSKIKQYMFLSAAFSILGFAYTVLAFSSTFTYFYLDLRNLFSLTEVNSNSFEIYYLASLVAYLFLAITFLPKKFKKRFHIMFVPLWYVNLQTFHISSLFILGFVFLRTVLNLQKTRSLDSFLVSFAFLMMLVYHASLLLLPFDITHYLLAHVLLASGFVSLLIMLIRVSRSGRKKK